MNHGKKIIKREGVPWNWAISHISIHSILSAGWETYEEKKTLIFA
jgi:hypothetical protein